MASVVINSTLVFVVIITLCFTLGDTSSIIASPTGYPFIQVIFNATQSYVGTNIMVAIVIVMFSFCTVSEVAAASRQIWSFARDRGLPGHSWLSKVRHGLDEWNCSVELTSPGFSRMEYPTASCHNHPHHRRTHLPHQHRFDCCAQRNYLARRRRNHGLLLPYHRLHRLPPSRRTCSARSQMDPGKVWSAHQYCSVSFLDATDLLFDLAIGYSRDCGQHELV